jgi:hypothetical protein
MGAAARALAGIVLLIAGLALFFWVARALAWALNRKITAPLEWRDDDQR